MFLLFLQISQILAMDPSEYLLKSNRLPDDLNFLPTLSNGHLGYTVFGDAIYMDGVYNGQGGDSRRARIPNWLNLTLNMAQEWQPIGAAPSYEMDLSEGYFRWLQNFTNAGGDVVALEQRTYPHRYYDRALIYELIVAPLKGQDPLNITAKWTAGPSSDAFYFTFINTASQFRVLRGTTRLVEHPKFQSNSRTIHVAFSESFEVDQVLKLQRSGNCGYYRYVLAIDHELNVALKEMQNVLSLSQTELLSSHAAEWRKFWSNFSINISENLELSQIINAGIFYLSNSLPSLNTNQPRTTPYYGLSPTGLGRGHLDDDYEGHNFWDTEIWMLPVIEQINPAWGRLLLEYRLLHLGEAQYNALITNYEGARFPWESAYTGTEVVNPCCPEVAAQQVHISSDIVFGLEQYYALTKNPRWLCDQAWPLVREIAAFLVSRVTWNEDTQKYHIAGVMGPDEDHTNVTDNVYTNVGFKMALEFASFVQLKCSPTSKDLGESWLHVAQHLNILYDPQRDYHPQCLGYRPGEEIKQADAILLGYPLQSAMNRSTRINDLLTYERVMRPSGPAMTWSMFAINFLDVEDFEKADKYFQKSYKDYIRPDFKVWSETKLGLRGAANFLTGIGGFLQAIINGYAGVRFHRQADVSILELKKARVLPLSQGLLIRGLKFVGFEFELQVWPNNSRSLKVLQAGLTCLELEASGVAVKVVQGFSITLGADSAAYIKTLGVC